MATLASVNLAEKQKLMADVMIAEIDAEIADLQSKKEYIQKHGRKPTGRTSPVGDATNRERIAKAFRAQGSPWNNRRWIAFQTDSKNRKEFGDGILDVKLDTVRAWWKEFSINDSTAMEIAAANVEAETE